MPSQGPFAPGTIVNVSRGSTPWTTVTNAGIDDGTSFAVDNTPGNGDTDYIQATNFGFSLPVSAQLTGVLFTYKGKSSTSDGSLTEEIVQLIKGGTVQGANKASNSLSGALVQFSFGSNSDLWTLSLIPSDVNASNFGIAYVVQNTNVSLARIASVDAFRITIYYSISTRFMSVLSG